MLIDNLKGGILFFLPSTDIELGYTDQTITTITEYIVCLDIPVYIIIYYTVQRMVCH